MLLVDDDEAELAERDGLLGERVRADDEVDRAAGELRDASRGASPRVALPVSDATRNRDVSSSRRIVR